MTGHFKKKHKHVGKKKKKKRWNQNEPSCQQKTLKNDLKNPGKEVT